MKLKIIQLNYGDSANGRKFSACAEIDRPVKGLSAFEQRPYLSIRAEFTLHRDRPARDQATQELVEMPACIEARYMLVGNFEEQLLGEHQDQRASWPQPSEYRNKLARMIANMVSTSDLNALDDTVPAIVHA